VAVIAYKAYNLKGKIVGTVGANASKGFYFNV
jgi:hypothetical protein